ncbi:MAG: PHP domain-containing protein [Polyangia bacterium]
MLDLHSHSTASDGTLTPSELVELAERIGLTALALTDHDTVAGLAEAERAARGAAVELVPGVELSARDERGTLHIVGLYLDRENPELLAALERVREMRRERNPKMAEALERLGVPVSVEEAARFAGGEVVGRPHFAAAMVEKGHVENTEQAYRRFLDRERPAHVPKQRLEPEECIRLIRGAGGLPVLAHPLQTKRRGAALERLADELVEMGLGGIEVFCSGHTPPLTRELELIARNRDLVRSGGSDFHGEVKPNIRLGRGPGSLYVPDDLLGPIRRAAGGD